MDMKWINALLFFAVQRLDCFVWVDGEIKKNPDSLEGGRRLRNWLECLQIHSLVGFILDGIKRGKWFLAFEFYMSLSHSDVTNYSMKLWASGLKKKVYMEAVLGFTLDWIALHS